MTVLLNQIGDVFVEFVTFCQISSQLSKVLPNISLYPDPLRHPGVQHNDGVQRVLPQEPPRCCGHEQRPRQLQPGSELQSTTTTTTSPDPWRVGAVLRRTNWRTDRGRNPLYCR